MSGLITIFTPVFAFLKEKKQQNLKNKLILIQDNSTNEYHIYNERNEINQIKQKIEQTTSSKQTIINIFHYSIYSLFIISILLNIIYFYNHKFVAPDPNINFFDRLPILTYNLFNMFLYALKNSISVLLIASIIIGISNIVISQLFYKSKFKRLLISVIILITNIIIWLNANDFSESILELSENSFQRYLIIIFLMISLFVIALNNNLLTHYLFNYFNHRKDYNNTVKRLCYITTPLPLFFIIKWIILNNGYLRIIEFLKNL
ncbi:TPA: hypothetical protein ACXEFH_000503 [Staphylococcus aureus]